MTEDNETVEGDDTDTDTDTDTAEPERLHGALVTWSRDQQVLHVERSAYLDLVGALKDDGFLQCIDVCGVDYLGHGGQRDLPADVEPERFEVVANLINHRERRRVRIRVQVPEDDPTCPSLNPHHVGTEYPEREVFDLFGIRFDGHPDMSRILLPETWEGHPLRKDHTVGRIPVQFKGAPS